MCLSWLENSKFYKLLDGKGGFILYVKFHPTFSKAAGFVFHNLSGKLFPPPLRRLIRDYRQNLDIFLLSLV